jgi:uncharacterized membrane protein YccC
VFAIWVPLAAGFVTGRSSLVALPAMGALLSVMIDTGGPYRARVRRIGIAAVFGGAAGLVVGSLIHGRGWIAVVALVVVAGVSSILARLGGVGSVTGLQLLVYSALGLGTIGELRPWWHTALEFVAGAVWALILITPPWSDSPGARALRDAMVSLARAISGNWAPRPAPAARASLRSRARDRVLRLGEQLIGGRIAWTFSARLMVCTGVAAVITQVVSLQRSYWVVLTVAIILKPDYGSVFARAVQRGIGTIAGAVLGAAILAVVPYGVRLLIPFGVLAELLPYGKSRNFGLSATFLTPLVVLLIDLQAGGGWRLAADRLIDTLIACAVVLGIGYAGRVSADHVRAACHQPPRVGLVARGGGPRGGDGRGHGDRGRHRRRRRRAVARCGAPADRDAARDRGRDAGRRGAAGPWRDACRS